MCALRVSFKYYHGFDLLWTLLLSTQFSSCAPGPCVTDWWSWALIMIIIISMQTHHSCLYWVDFASPLRARGLSQSPRSRVLHLRTSAAAARSFWRCCCGSLLLLQSSLARSSVRLDRNTAKLTRVTPNYEPVPFTERLEKHANEFRCQRVKVDAADCQNCS